MERKVKVSSKIFFVFSLVLLTAFTTSSPAQQQQEYNTFYLIIIIIIIILMPATTRRQASSLSPRVVREMTPSPRYKGVLKNSGFNFYPMGKVLTFLG